MSLDTHAPFEPAAEMPSWWRPEPGPEWQLDSGEFPHVPDPALKSSIEEEKTDVR
jgi:hypothetical protein